MTFTVMALQGFGGVAAVAQQELVEKKRWLTREEFVEEWAVAQTLPGPNVVNLAIMIGAHHFGVSGAMAAVAGMMAIPLVVVLALIAFYTSYADDPQLTGALRGMGAVAAGLVAASGCRLLTTLRTHPLGIYISAAIAMMCFIAVAVLRWPLVYVLLGLGSASCLLTYRRIK
jgi:chromate transporter